MSGVGDFTELSVYKNTILEMLISNDNIVRAVANPTSNFLDEPPIDKQDIKDLIDNPSDLLYQNIYPYSYIPETQDTQKTFITLKFGNYKYVNNYFKSGEICFYVFSHYKLLRTDYSTLRTDYIINEIHKIFNATDKLGINKLGFKTMSDFNPNTYLLGSYIVYDAIDFMKTVGKS